MREREMGEVGSSAGTRTRVPGIAGLTFVVLFLAGALMSGSTPDSDAPDQEWLDWFADSGNRIGEVIGMFLLAAAGLAFLPFLAGLVRRIRAHGPTGDGVTIGWAAGLLFALSTMVAGVAINQAAVGIEIGQIPEPDDADVLRMAEQAGFGILLLCGGWSAAVAIGTLSWAARRTGALPSWLAVAGLVVAVLLIFSVVFLPMVLLPLWVLVTSVVLLRGTPTAGAAAEPVQAGAAPAVP